MSRPSLMKELSAAIRGQQVSRRGFLKVGGATLGGFALASIAPVGLTDDQTPSLVGSVELNAYVQIADDGTITIFSGTPEMGQGIKTSLPMIVAEEMGANWEDVLVEQTAEIDTDRYGNQWTGGSYTLNNNWNLMRQMGASAREMFLAAGALAMEVPKDELKAENSIVFHIKSDASRTFAELAALAYRQPVPDVDSLVFKERSEYTILGTGKSQVDSLEIVTGIGDFGIDTRVPNMLYGVYEKSPSVGGRIISANLDEIRQEPGIVDAYLIKGTGNPRELMDGVGIVGENTWAVFKARQKLKANWDESDASKDSWTAFKKFAEELTEKTGPDLKMERGDVDAAFADDRNTMVESFYEFPYVTHLCLEPMNCTADYRPGSNGTTDHLEVWLPTQFGPRFQENAMTRYGLEKDQLTINIKRMGGSFGRRSINEYAFEAIELSRLSGRPVKLTWSREDSMRNDFFRVGGFQQVRAAMTPEGKVAGWEEHAIGVHQDGNRVIGSGFIDRAFPLVNFPVVRGSHTLREMKTLCGPWRAPWSNTHAFVTQCFIHELAVAAGRDHAGLLIEMLGEPRWLDEGNILQMHTGRAVGVIERAVEESGWGRELPEGRGLGLAFYFCHAAHVAEVAEVSVDANRKLTLHKVTAAIDVGPIINMSGALNQVQGSIVDGYSTMVGQKISMENGVIEQTNLHQYPVLRIGATPEIDVHFIESDYEPTGLGEPALPPLAPAVANAIFDATGHRVRKMPLMEEGYRV